MRIRLWRSGPSGTHVFDTGLVHVGRGRKCELRLDDRSVAREHAQIEAVDHRCRITDLGSKGGTLVNGQRIHEPTLVRATDEVRIGPWALQLFTSVREPIEDELLAGLDQPDGALVYADWLEQQGDLRRAAVLRARVRPTTDRELRRLAALVDEDWRMCVLPARIEGCARGDCPGTWNALAPTPDATRRNCEPCHRGVQRVDTMEHARQLHRTGRAFVVDVAVPRHDHDLSVDVDIMICANPPPPRR